MVFAFYCVFFLVVKTAKAAPPIDSPSDSIQNETVLRANWVRYEDYYVLDRVSSRSFIKDPSDKWPGSIGSNGEWIVQVPYVTSQLELDVYDAIKPYMDIFHDYSCIRWVERTYETDYVTITGELPPFDTGDPNSCQATLGKHPSALMYLTASCIGLHLPNSLLSNIPHEMMHILGFIHEHQRADRDCYINLNEEANNNTWVLSLYPEQLIDEPFPYDTQSVMHYFPYNNDMTSKTGEPVGPQKPTLSTMDWIKVNYIYCNGPHFCDIDPLKCDEHKKIQAQCLSNNI